MRQTAGRYLVQRGLRVLTGLLLATCVGTGGYMVVEGWSLVDSLYMSVITLSTVGFSEVAPLSTGGRLFTVLLIVIGVGTALYLLGALGELIVDSRIRDLIRRDGMARRIRGKQGHVIVAGFGRFGRVVTAELEQAGRRFVVLDQDENLEGEFTRLGWAYVIGSASSDDDLERAGIRGAEAIVAATPSEAENVFITLAARELNPEIRIYGRSETAAGSRRLLRAGADHVTAPFQMGGSRVAGAIIHPAVVDFLELVSQRGDRSIAIEELVVEEESELIGKVDRRAGAADRGAARDRAGARRRRDAHVCRDPRIGSPPATSSW